MAELSKIQWTDHTFNPWIGCQKVSPGCDLCYAETWDNRFGGEHFGPRAPRKRTSAANWEKPYRWDKQAKAQGRRFRVFPSLCDPFDNRVPREWRASFWRVIAQTPNLDWLLLTKRPQNVAKMLPPDWGDGWPGVWLGVSVEDQVRADARIPFLLEIPAAVRWVSAEPLLGPVDFTRVDYGVHDDFKDCGGHPDPAFPLESVGVGYTDALKGHYWHGTRVPDGTEHEFQLGIRYPAIDWIIVGGESGPGARPFDIGWARSIIEQCRAASVPVFVKQLGAVPIDSDGSLKRIFKDDHSTKRDRVVTDSKGGNPDEWPVDLRVREFPQVADNG